MCAQKQAEPQSKQTVPVRETHADFEIALDSFLYQFERKLRDLDPQTADTDWGRQIVQHFSNLLRNLMETGNYDNTALVLPERGYEQMAEIINGLLSTPSADCGGMTYGEFFGIAPGYVDYDHMVYVFAAPGARISSAVLFPMEPEVAMVSVEPEGGYAPFPESGPIELDIYGRTPARTALREEERAQWAAEYFFEELYQRLSYVTTPTEEAVADATSTLITDMQTLWRSRFGEEPPDADGIMDQVGTGLEAGFSAAVSAAALPRELAGRAQLGADSLTEMMQDARRYAASGRTGGFVVESEADLRFLRENAERFGIENSVLNKLSQQSRKAGGLAAVPEARRTVQLRSDEYMRFLLDAYSERAQQLRQAASGDLARLFRTAGFTEAETTRILAGRNLSAAQDLVFSLSHNERPLLERYVLSFGQGTEMSAEALFTKEQIQGRARHVLMGSWAEFREGWRAARSAGVSVPRALGRAIRRAMMYTPERAAVGEIRIRPGETRAPVPAEAGAAEGAAGARPAAAREGWLPNISDWRRWSRRAVGVAIAVAAAYLIFRLACGGSPEEASRRGGGGVGAPPLPRAPRGPSTVSERRGLVPTPGAETVTAEAGTAEAEAAEAAPAAPAVDTRTPTERVARRLGWPRSEFTPEGRFGPESQARISETAAQHGHDANAMMQQLIDRFAEVADLYRIMDTGSFSDIALPLLLKMRDYYCEHAEIPSVETVDGLFREAGFAR